MFGLSHSLITVNWSCRHLVSRSQHPPINLLPFNPIQQSHVFSASLMHMFLDHERNQEDLQDAYRKTRCLGINCDRDVSVQGTAAIVLPGGRQPSSSSSLSHSSWGNVSHVIKYHVELKHIFICAWKRPLCRQIPPGDPHSFSSTSTFKFKHRVKNWLMVNLSNLFIPCLHLHVFEVLIKKF